MAYNSTTQSSKDSFLGCAFLILMCFCISGVIGVLFDNSGSTTLSSPKVKFDDVGRHLVRISWEPLENADYYILEDISDDLPEAERKTIIRNKTEYVVRRHVTNKISFTIQACSDSEKYAPSSKVKINVDSISNVHKESNLNLDDLYDNYSDTEPSPVSTTDSSTKDDYQKDNDDKSNSRRSGYLTDIQNEFDPAFNPNRSGYVTDLQPDYDPEFAREYGLDQKTDNDTRSFPSGPSYLTDSQSIYDPDYGRTNSLIQKTRNDTNSFESDKIALDPVQPKVVETNDSVVVLWDKINNANQYLLEVKTGNSEKSYSIVIHDNIYKFSNLKPNKEYFVTVTAIPKDDTRYTPSTSKTVSFTVKP